MTKKHFEADPVTLREALARAIVKESMLDVEAMFSLSPTTMLSLMGSMLGRRAACIDAQVLDNEEVRNILLKQGADYKGDESKDCLLLNFEAAYNEHKAFHDKLREHGMKEADANLEQIIKKGKCHD